MPINKEDIEKLLSGHEDVMAALARDRPRRAAQLLCENFEWLLSRGEIWESIEVSLDEINEKTRQENLEAQLLTNIVRFLEDEKLIFIRLDIDDSRVAPILDDAYRAVRMSAGDLDAGFGRDQIENLYRRLETAAKAICDEKRGKWGQFVRRIVCWKGAAVLGGAALAGANILALPADAGAVSSISVKVGLIIIRNNTGDIIDIAALPEA